MSDGAGKSPLAVVYPGAAGAAGAAGAEPRSAAQEAAVAAAEAIAAEAAAGIAAEAAAVATEAVNAASLAAGRAEAKASRIAAEAAAEVAAVAEAVVEKAAAAAAAADRQGVPAAGDMAEAVRIADGVVQAVSTAAAQTATRANLAAAQTADAVAAEAATVAADVVAAAAAAACQVMAAAEAAADLLLAAAAAARALPWQAAGPDAAAHVEWASMLADPVMPRFGASESLETTASATAPAEQGLWRDISLARRMQAALKASEAHFEAAFRSAPTAMLIVSLGTGRPARFLQVNDALSRLTGRSTSELLDFGFVDLAHPQHRILEQEIGSPAGWGDEQPVERLRRWVHADGHDMWVRILMAALPPSPERAGQLVCQVEDVTAQLSADAALRSSEARFRLAFAGAPQPAALIGLSGNRPGRLLAVNRAALALFGRSEIEMPWLHLESLSDPGDRLAVLDLLDRLASGELSGYRGRFRYQKANGHPGWFELSAHAVNGPDGIPDHLLAYLRDDTAYLGAKD